MSPRPFDIIAAVNAQDGGIGSDGKIPWAIKQDMQYFRELTTTTIDPNKVNALIMGRKTWESLPKRPLPSRLNIVISTTQMQIPGAIAFPSFHHALTFLQNETSLVERIFVVGGARVYQEALEHTDLGEVHITRVYPNVEIPACDCFFPIDTFEYCNMALKTQSDIFNEGNYMFCFQTFYKPSPPAVA